jgi:hypothetical protein
MSAIASAGRDFPTLSGPVNGTKSAPPASNSRVRCVASHSRPISGDVDTVLTKADRHRNYTIDEYFQNITVFTKILRTMRLRLGQREACSPATSGFADIVKRWELRTKQLRVRI